MVQGGDASLEASLISYLLNDINPMKYLLLFLSIFLFVQKGVAQESVVIGTDSMNIANLFSQQISVFPQEKIYMQTDKIAYVTGETVWMRIHLVDAVFLQQANASRYVYVELFNPLSKIIKRLMIRPDSLGYFHGHLSIDESLPEGSYTLRTYTRFMQNLGEEYFFCKSIYIADPLSVELLPSITYSFEQKRTSADICFTRPSDNKKVLPQECSVLLDSDDVEIEAENLSFNVDSVARYSFKTNSGILLLKTVYQGKKYNRFFRIPISENCFDVSFFPEGGHALMSTNMQMAFKALNANGMSENITGIVYDDIGNKCVTFESEHLGMGSFLMFYQPGRTYHAVCTNYKGISKRFELPVAVSNAVSLKMLWDNNYLRVALAQSVEASLSSKTYLVAHVRGVVIYSQPWDEVRGFLNFSRDFLPAGIIHFLLVDEKRNILSERLVFSLHEGILANVSLTSDKKSYMSRDKIRLGISVTDENNTPLSGNFSISVVDKNMVSIDSTNTILSTLLLTSELKGYIESPMSYMRRYDRRTVRALDVLMMTQGWRRYDVPAVLKGQLTTDLKYPVESERVVSGRVEGFFSALKGGYVTMTTRGEVIGSAIEQIDEEGKFSFHNVEYPDKTWYILQASTKKGSQKAFIKVDSMGSFPPVTLPLAYLDKKILQPKLDYVTQENEKYVIENGMRVVNLAEVEVLGVADKLGTSSSFYSVGTSKVITAEDIEKRHYTSIFDVMRFLPGVTVMGSTVLYHQASPLAIVDDIPQVDFDYSDLDVSDISDIFVSPPASIMAIFGQRAINGAIIINTKKGFFAERNKLNKNMQIIKPIGYQQTVEFYSPKYETEAAKNKPDKDLRTTIYWKPDVIVDNTGVATLIFYSADPISEYGIVIEGTTKQGYLIYSDIHSICLGK